jgi:Protein of unknown function (DUF2612)
MSVQIQDFDFSVDILSALLWQHNEADALRAILEAKQSWYDTNQEQFWSDWYNDVFNLDTANEFGRRVWSIILNIPLVITATPSPSTKIGFGFSNKRKNFNHGNFNASGSSTISLTEEQQRLVLKLRYYQLVARPNVIERNEILKRLFGDVYSLDPLTMGNIVIVFGYEPGSQLRLILEEYDLMLRPAAVGVSYVIATKTQFGFGEYRKNFNHGNFAND